jgi:hypothetical protein
LHTLQQQSLRQNWHGQGGINKTSFFLFAREKAKSDFLFSEIYLHVYLAENSITPRNAKTTRERKKNSACGPTRVLFGLGPPRYRETAHGPVEEPVPKQKERISSGAALPAYQVKKETKPRKKNYYSQPAATSPDSSASKTRKKNSSPSPRRNEQRSGKGQG